MFLVYSYCSYWGTNRLMDMVASWMCQGVITTLIQKRIIAIRVIMPGGTPNQKITESGWKTAKRNPMGQDLRIKASSRSNYPVRCMWLMAIQ